MDANKIDILPNKIKMYNDTYYRKNKAKILEKINTKVLCAACNCSTSKSNMSKHTKTEKHKLNMKIIELRPYELQIEL